METGGGGGRGGWRNGGGREGGGETGGREGGGGSILEETLSELVGVLELERASLKMNFVQVRNVHCNFIR